MRTAVSRQPRAVIRGGVDQVVAFIVRGKVFAKVRDGDAAVVHVASVLILLVLLVFVNIIGLLLDCNPFYMLSNARRVQHLACSACVPTTYT